MPNEFEREKLVVKDKGVRRITDPPNYEPETVDDVVLACVALHNYI